MIKNLSKSAGISLALVMAFFAQGVMPINAAHAVKPAGNNGTVKVNDETLADDSGNQNEPHLATCSVNIRWYGYDEGLRASTVTFNAQHPTDSEQLVSPTEPQNSSFIAPERENGNTLSHEMSYTLAFAGDAAEQGYKVKVTVFTDGSQGSDTKSKVFWMPALCGEDDDEEDVTAPEPKYIGETCTSKLSGFIIVDNDFYYEVAVDGADPTSTHNGLNVVTAPVSVTITAYDVNDEVAGSWTHDFAVANGCGGGIEQPPADKPVVPAAPAPATPVVAAGTGSTASELPTTGPGEMGALIALLAAVATYGAAYFAQPKRLYE